jgi:phage terminase large subunit
MSLTVPHLYAPRTYQVGPLAALDRGATRIATVWHRRAGKDKTAENGTIKKALAPERLGGRRGVYYHVFPDLKMGRRTLWDGIDAGGVKCLEHFPPGSIRKVDEGDMRIELNRTEAYGPRGGSVWQIVGAHDPDTLPGPNPVGIVLSEYSLQNPRAWGLLEPILRENGGWAWFTFTPRSRNHGFKLFTAYSAMQAKADPRFFCSLLTIRDTRRDAAGEPRFGEPVITDADIQADLAHGLLDPDLVPQEYYCSFDAALKGAIYGPQLEQARASGRIVPGLLPYQPELGGLVESGWDLGVGLNMVVWLFQRTAYQTRALRCYTARESGFAHYAAKLEEWRALYGYAYGQHFGPHDLEATEIGSGKTRLEEAKAVGIRFKVIRRLHAQKGEEVRERHNATRQLLARTAFAEEGCDSALAPGVTALEQYRYAYDEDRKVFLAEPVHDWTSHYADAFGTYAVGIRSPERDKAREERVALQTSTHGPRGARPLAPAWSPLARPRR